MKHLQTAFLALFFLSALPILDRAESACEQCLRNSDPKFSSTFCGSYCGGEQKQYQSITGGAEGDTYKYSDDGSGTYENCIEIESIPIHMSRKTPLEARIKLPIIAQRQSM